MEECKICGYQCKNIASLSKHIRDQHNINSEVYWNMFNVRSKCSMCDKDTKWISLGHGYQNFCGHVCSAIVFRKELKNDSDKYRNFVNKVSNNTKNSWRNRPPELNTIIRTKIGKSKKVLNSKLSKTELKIKYGKNINGYYPSLKKFWDNASDEQAIEVYKKIAVSGAKNADMRKSQEWKDKNQLEIDEWYEENSDRIYQFISNYQQKDSCDG